MQSPTHKRSVSADDVGIHFVGVDREDILVEWGEIESVDAARWKSADGSSFLEVYVYHFSGVDFRFHDVESGYEQVMAAMEQHLIGFSRKQVETHGENWEQKIGSAVPWKRDDSVQPFKLSDRKIDPRPPTKEEVSRMESARRATISTCEKTLGRPLLAHELECIHVGFENARIVGSIAQPLYNLLVNRKAEIKYRAE